MTCIQCQYAGCITWLVDDYSHTPTINTGFIKCNLTTFVKNVGTGCEKMAVTEHNLGFCSVLPLFIFPASTALLHFLFFFLSTLLSSFPLPLLSLFLSTTLSYFPAPWSTFLSIILAPSSTLFCPPYSLLLSLTLLFPLLSPLFLSSSPSIFPFSHLIFLSSLTHSDFSSHFPLSFLPFCCALAYVSYIHCSFSIYSTHPHSRWLLSSRRPSSPVMNHCYHYSTPNKCQHGIIVG